MANCKSIRLDFPAADLSVSDRDLIVVLQDALLLYATNPNATNQGKLRASIRLNQAVARAQVDNYDDRFGGPVFYIP